MTKLQRPCRAEYTLTAIDSGTYSVVDVPVMQGTVVADPNALLRIEVTDAGMVTESNPLHDRNALDPMTITDVGMLTDCNPLQLTNADDAMAVKVVLISMFPEQHAVDGLVLLTQPEIGGDGVADGDAVCTVAAFPSWAVPLHELVS